MVIAFKGNLKISVENNFFGIVLSFPMMIWSWDVLVSRLITRRWKKPIFRILCFMINRALKLKKKSKKLYKTKKWMRERKKFLPSIPHRSMARIYPKKAFSQLVKEEKVYSSFVMILSSITNEAYIAWIRSLNLEQQQFFYDISHPGRQRLFECSLKNFPSLSAGACSGKTVTMKALFNLFCDSSKMLLTKMLNILLWLWLFITDWLPEKLVALPSTLFWGLNLVLVVTL